MAWLSEIAGKAEALLDRVDQVAASSIQNVGLNASPKVGMQRTSETGLPYEPTAAMGAEKGDSSSPSSAGGPRSLLRQSQKSTHQSNAPISGPETRGRSPPSPSSYKAFNRNREREPSDESIFEFLNTPTKEKKAKGQPPRSGIRPVPSTDAIVSELEPPTRTAGVQSVGAEREKKGEKEREGGGGEGEEEEGGSGEGREGPPEYHSVEVVGRGEEEGLWGRGEEEADGGTVGGGGGGEERRGVAEKREGGEFVGVVMSQPLSSRVELEQNEVAPASIGQAHQAMEQQLVNDTHTHTHKHTHTYTDVFTYQTYSASMGRS